MKILFVASEVAPFAKTGGLADVAGSLPRALRQLGHDVRIVLPCYQVIQEQGYVFRKGRRSVEVSAGGRSDKGLLRQTAIDDVPVYCLHHQGYFQRPGLYGTAAGDYPDNALRFGFFCRAVLQLLRRLDFRPDVVHLNDWQTGLIPVLLRAELAGDPFFSGVATILTIHNLGYQGIFPADTLAALGLPPALFSLDGLEYYGKISFLKGGLLFSDLITTVSETYCREIQTPGMGFGFDGILRHRREVLFGILNGIDTRQWDPAGDSRIPHRYDAADLKGKGGCKRALQKEMGLAVAPATPIVCMVTRLDMQKGLDLLEDAWEGIVRRDLQFVLLGSGERKHTAFFEALRDRHPGKVAIRLSFDDSLARRIYAGSDIFLMPSRYEPCGLGQMIALRYGTVPVVRQTGGLADTVIDPAHDAGNANGFTFQGLSGAALLGALDRALARFADRRSWRKLMRQGMTSDFSWTRSAERYVELYRKAMEVRGG